MVKSNFKEYAAMQDSPDFRRRALERIAELSVPGLRWLSEGWTDNELKENVKISKASRILLPAECLRPIRVGEKEHFDPNCGFVDNPFIAIGYSPAKHSPDSAFETIEQAIANGSVYRKKPLSGPHRCNDEPLRFRNISSFDFAPFEPTPERSELILINQYLVDIRKLLEEDLRRSLPEVLSEAYQNHRFDISVGASSYDWEPTKRLMEWVVQNNLSFLFLARVHAGLINDPLLCYHLNEE